MKGIRLSAVVLMVTAGCAHERVLAPTPAARPAATILVRGPEATRDSTQRPLFILDGVIVPDSTDFAALNILSVEVLKGKTAIDRYGKRAINGVVLIRTK
jgi:hypothetical protein